VRPFSKFTIVLIFTRNLGYDLQCFYQYDIFSCRSETITQEEYMPILNSSSSVMENKSGIDDAGMCDGTFEYCV